MGLILRVVDEIRTGLRDLSLEELRDLTSMWSDVNGGVTPSEMALRLLNDVK